jgi:hypothetical protein
LGFSQKRGSIVGEISIRGLSIRGIHHAVEKIGEMLGVFGVLLIPQNTLDEVVGVIEVAEALFQLFS